MNHKAIEGLVGYVACNSVNALCTPTGHAIVFGTEQRATEEATKHGGLGNFKVDKAHFWKMVAVLLAGAGYAFELESVARWNEVYRKNKKALDAYRPIVNFDELPIPKDAPSQSLVYYRFTNVPAEMRRAIQGVLITLGQKHS